jgi:hypothetical protein
VSSDRLEVAVDFIVSQTGMKDQSVRELLLSGWSFSTNAKGEYKWEKQAGQELTI